MIRPLVYSMFVFISVFMCGQNQTAKQVPLERPIPLEAATDEAFAKALKDPNIFVGVFDIPTKDSLTTLSTGEILENIPGYMRATIRFSLKELRCVKPIKGDFVEPVIFVSTVGPPLVEGRPRIPSFIPPRGSKWVLALEKTSKSSRMARFGEEIEKYTFLNDSTMFTVLWHGYGALCLKWPEKDKRNPEHRHLVKVPQTIVDDLEAIERVIPYIHKDNKTSEDIARINGTLKNLKTDLAKSIFAKVLRDKNANQHDPNNK